jgi:hypothetical protein
MRNLPWYLLGGMGIAVAVEGVLGVGWWPLNILGGVFLFNAAYALYRQWTDGGIPRSRRTAVRADFGGTGALRPYTPTEHEARIERVARHRRPLSGVVTP